MRRSFVAFGSIVLLLIVSAYDVRACDCASSGPPCQTFWQTDAVFSATMISKSVITVEPSRESLPKQPQVAVKLLVEDTFRGSLGGNDIEIITGMGESDCGFNFQKGRKYLVYATEHRGRLYTGICSRTRLLSEAGEDLVYFQNLPPENSGSRIRVKVLKHLPRLNDRNNNYEVTPMQGVKIVADNGEQKFEGRTNPAGEYEFKELPPGKYKVTSDIPQNERNHWQTEVTVTDRACTIVEFTNNLEAKMSGIMFNEIRAASDETEETRHAETASAYPYEHTTGATETGSQLFMRTTKTNLRNLKHSAGCQRLRHCSPTTVG